jgi:large subunit ribosomal protein L18
MSLYGQLIDDEKRMTIGLAKQKGTNSTSGSALGISIVALCRKKGIKRLVFDRGGYKYHGVIKQIADTVREGGIII